MRKQLFYISFIWFCVATLSSCSLLKKADYSDETPVEIISDKDMMTDETPTEIIEQVEPEKPDETPSLVTYERSYCFGMCPVFKSEILADGTVMYEGINFVDNMGNHMAKVNATDLDSIITIIKRVNYFELDSIYDNPAVMDIPAVVTSAQLDGKSHSIYDRWKAPKELKTLYKLLDEIYSRLEWKATIENE